MPEEKILDTRYAYRGRVVTLRLEQVQLENGAQFTREIVEHRAAVAMVAVDAEGQVFLVHQYRAGIGKRIYEVPAGVLEAGEEVLSGAQRELQEEIGFRAEKLEPLGAVYTSPGFCTEVIHLLLATGLSPARLPGDVDEDIAVVRLPLAEALALVGKPDVQDAKTVVALERARARLQRR